MRKKFKTVYGKESNKYFIFKNETRRFAFQSSDKILGVLYKIALFVFVLSIMAVVLSFLIIFFGAIITFGLIFLVPESERFQFSKQLAKVSIKVIPYAFVIFILVYAAKFIFEWLFILRETAELKQDVETNKHYLAVSGAVRKVKIVGLLATITFLTMAGIFSVLISGSEAGGDKWNVVLVVIAAIALIVNKIISTKEFIKIEPDIKKIIDERKENNQDAYGNPRPPKKPVPPQTK